MELIEKEIDELETYKGKWVNLHITTKGQFEGGLVHDSEEAALKAIEEWLVEVNRNYNHFGYPTSITVNGKHVYYYPKIGRAHV